jgi:hypothetical protein
LKKLIDQYTHVWEQRYASALRPEFLSASTSGQAIIDLVTSDPINQIAAATQMAIDSDDPTSY